MMRRFWFIALLFLAGCGADRGSQQLEFPKTLAGGWGLAETTDIPAESIPPGIVQLGLVRARRAAYEGPDKLSVVVYDMSSWGGALELVQLWRSEPGMYAFQTGAEVGPYFVVLDSASLDYGALQSLSEELETSFAESSR